MARLSAGAFSETGADEGSMTQSNIFLIWQCGLVVCIGALRVGSLAFYFWGLRETMQQQSLQPHSLLLSLSLIPCNGPRLEWLSHSSQCFNQERKRPALLGPVSALAEAVRVSGKEMKDFPRNGK